MEQSAMPDGFWAICQNTPFPVVLLTEKKQINMMNNAARQLFIHDAEYVKHSCAESKQPFLSWLKNELLNYQAGSSEILEFEKRLALPGNNLWFMVKVKDMLDTNGAITGILVFLNDITKQKQIEFQLTAANKELAAVEEELRQQVQELELNRELLENINRQLEETIEFLPDATFVVDKDRRVVAWNRAMEDLTGVKKQAIIGKGGQAYSIPLYGQLRPGLINLIFGDDVLEPSYRSIKIQGQTIYAKIFVPHLRGGEGCHLWIKASPLFDSSGNLTGAIESVRDITAQKNAEEELFREKERLRVTLSSIGDAVIAVDTEGKITLMNAVAEDLTGYEQVEAYGRHVQEVFNIINEYTRKAVENPIKRVLAEGKIVGLANHTALIARDGTERSIADSAAPIKDAAGNTLGAVLVFRDVTEERKMLEALEASDVRLRSVLDSLTAHIAVLDSQGNIVAVNEAWERFALNNGIEAPDLVGAGVNYLDVCRRAQGESHEGAREVLEGIKNVFAGKLPKFYYEYPCHSIDEKRWFMLCVTPLAQLPGGVVVAHMNITKRKLAEEKLLDANQRLLDIIDFLPDATFVVDNKGVVIAWNNAIEKMSGLPKKDIIGKGNYAYAVPLYGKPRPLLLDYILKNTTGQESPYYDIKSRGKVIFAETYAPGLYKGKGAMLWATASPLYDKEGCLVGAIESIRDITDRKHMERQLTYLSKHDNLTGLYNRSYFEYMIRRYEAESQCQVSIIVCDVDGLKLVNDTIGHEAGDRLLIAATNAIKKALRQKDLVARVGGDEFAILLKENNEALVEEVCRRIETSISKYNRANSRLPLSISVGYAVNKDSGTSLLNLFKEADNNMYRRKLHRKRSTRSSLVQTLMKALEARDFITEGHGDRLQYLVANLAKEINLPDHTINDLRLLARFHDIGKVGIPDRILFKPGPLTPEEAKEMQRHSEIGNRIALSSADLVPIADWILKHHEWWNGSGYPLGLKGEEIPMECRILAIVDAYDAMTSDRPYRRAMPHRAALRELAKCAGTQFDPLLVKQFIKLMDAKAKSIK